MRASAERDWRLRPIVRFAAGAITLLFAVATCIVVIELAKVLVTSDWKALGYPLLLCVLCAAGWLTMGRLFAIAAWTGEEPVVHFDDDDGESDATT